MATTRTATHHVRFASGEVQALAFAPYLRDGDEIITKAEFARARPAYCRAELLKLLAPGATVYTQLRHASASGMQRRISLHVVHGGQIRCVDTLAADLMGDKIHKDGGIVVNGCGMDMGFHLVYSLGASLWPQGTPEPHGTRNGEPDSTGGYALHHEWL